MSKSKRILSFFMAVLMLSSTFSIMANAKAGYTNEFLSYDDVNQPVLTPEQCSSMLLDYADNLLFQMNQEKSGSLVFDLSPIGTLDLTSVNSAISGIYSLINDHKPLIDQFGAVVLGDLSGINVSALATARRIFDPTITSATEPSDFTVIKQLLKFLDDNKEIISKAVGGTLKMGALSSMVDLSSFNANKMIKTMLYQMVYPETKLDKTDPKYKVTPDPIPDTVDNMIQVYIDNLVIGKEVEDPITHVKSYDGLVPQLAGHESVINIVNGSASTYDFVEELLRNAYNLIAVPMLNKEFKKAVREVCGYVYDDPNDPYNGHLVGTLQYQDILNADFTVPVHTFTGNATLISDLNNIFSEIISAVTKYTRWQSGDNSQVLDNLANAAKFVLEYTGNKFFKDYIRIKSTSEIEVMSNQELFSYIARSVLNSSISFMDIPDTAVTLTSVMWYAAKEFCAQYVPQIDYSSQSKDLNGILNMLADIAVYFVNQSIDMNPTSSSAAGAGLLSYGQGFDATFTSIMNWVKLKYGGLISANLNFQSSDSGWVTLDKIILSIVPLNWLPVGLNSPVPVTQDGSYCKELALNRVFSDLLNLNISNVFALANHRSDSEFASKTVKQVLIDSFVRIMNVVLPGTVKTTDPNDSTQPYYKTFDKMVENLELQDIIKGLFGALNTNKDKLLPAALPLITGSMGISVPEEYVDPEIMLPTRISEKTTFKILNNSKGLNTTASKGSARDALYKIKIDSITLKVTDGNASTISLEQSLDGYIIDGGNSASCTLTGGTRGFVPGGVLCFTMKYFVLGETGASITGTTPLTTMAFSYITGFNDDADTVVKLDPNADNFHSVSYKNNLYLNQDYNLKSLADQKVTITRTPDPDKKQTATSTVTRTGPDPSTTPSLVSASNNTITIAPWTNISDNNDGGIWNVPMYAVSDSATRPADGRYDIPFVYNATATNPNNSSSTETFTATQTVIFYNDYGLPALLNSELNARRDPSNYSDATVWNNYVSTLMGAFSTLNQPRNVSTFMTTIAPTYENAVTNLKEAVEALKKTEVASRIDTLKTDFYNVEPTNKDENGKDIPYYDSRYRFFGMSDFVPYTYLSYKNIRDAAKDMIDSQTAPVAPVRTDYTTDEAYALALTKYNTDLEYFNAHKVNLKPVDIAYVDYRFKLYANRLVPVAPIIDRLDETRQLVTDRVKNLSLSATNCSVTSWSAYSKALQFAVDVLNTPRTSLTQSKIDTARNDLIEAAKELVIAADYTALKLAIINADSYFVDPDTTKKEYTVASWDAFANAYTAAKAVPADMAATTDNQKKITDTAKALDDARNSLVIRPILPIPVPGNSSVVVDTEKQYIYGHVMGTQVIDDVTAPKGYQLVWHPVVQENNVSTYGTGTTVDVTKDGVIAATYTVIIFGDVNGDGNIDDQDTSICINVQNWKTKWDRTTEAYKYFAADLNKDNNIDTIDGDIISNSANYGIMIIDQKTGTVQEHIVS